MAHTLILNASFESLHIVSWQKALQLLFQGKVEVIEESESEVHTVRITIKIPAVLRLLQYVPTKQKQQVIRFSRTNVFLRDNFKCQYCGKKFNKTYLTLDHVIPVVQGGKKTWENIVTACKSCNQKKGGRTPAQAGVKLKRNPSAPQWLPYAEFRFQLSPQLEKWRIYLGGARDSRNSEEDDDGGS